MNNDSPLGIQELTKKAKLFGLPKNNELPDRSKEILDSANKSKRLLSTKELNILCESSHCDASKLEELQNRLPKLDQ